MSGGVGVHAKRLHRVVGSVEEDASTELHYSLMLLVEVFFGRNRQIEVEHLGALARRPGRRWELVDLLERDPRAGVRDEDQPVALRDAPAVGWLVACAVREPEQLSIELREAADVNGVEHHLAHPGIARHRAPPPRVVASAS